MQRPYKTYNGGKNGSGVYQAIINQIPPHEIFISGFGGNCGVMANKKTAAIANIVTDTDAAVVNDWKKISGINNFSFIKPQSKSNVTNNSNRLPGTGCHY